MNVAVKFFVFDLPPGFADAELDVKDNAKLSDVLDACLELFKQRKAAMDVNELRTATILINGKWSDTGAPVSHGDTITIIRPMDGG